MSPNYAIFPARILRSVNGGVSRTKTLDSLDPSPNVTYLN